MSPPFTFVACRHKNIYLNLNIGTTKLKWSVVYLFTMLRNY